MSRDDSLREAIEYGANVIVGAMRESRWAWYITEKEYWFLDQKKLRQAFIDAGHDVPSGYQDRFGIGVVDQDSAGEFLSKMEPFKVATETLSSILLSKVPASSCDDISELCPSLMVNFDTRRLVSLFPEAASFEDYAPDGWQGEYGSFLDEVPAQERYWVIGGVDHFAPFFASQ